MRLCKTYDFKGIKGIKLGRSLFGSPMMTVYFYLFNNVMIDTGFTHMQKETLDIAKNYDIKRIFLTHHHEDHSGNAAIIKKAVDAEVYGNSLTIQKMSVPFKILPYQTYMWGNAMSLTMKPVPKDIETDMGTMAPVHTPGHSKDHTTYFIKDAGVLFSGDLYLGDKIKFFRVDEDMGIQISSLKKVLKLDFQTLLCAHHPKLEHGKKHIENKLGFLEDLYGSIIALWQKGYPEKQIFTALNLKEALFIKYFCFGNVSMINGVKSAVRHYEMNKR
ncbi:MAG: MBL fold metallo-hydrolase [Desulfobacteraceae bacterium]|nr:MBL fold metallo-hydrolase [Desulfobacteraceae bacterium]